MSYENFPIAVVDNGGQWTHREYRVLNYLGCRAEIVSNVTPIEELERFKALVLSGGAPRIETESEALGLTSEYIDSEKWPILGICVGHQYMATHFGGKAGPAEIPEFGSSLLTLIDEGWILAGFPKEVVKKATIILNHLEESNNFYNQISYESLEDKAV